MFVKLCTLQKIKYNRLLIILYFLMIFLKKNTHVLFLEPNNF